MQSTQQLNQIYTISYSQPLEYRFSLDSIFLAQRINDWLMTQKQHPAKIADLCAGCGVVGLELLFHLHQRSGSKPSHIDFIEIQSDYETHFVKNKLVMQELLKSDSILNLTLENYQNLIGQPRFNSVYDLIVCNPPYFHVGRGKLSPSNFKNRCRYFIDSDLFNLLTWIHFALSKTGSAFVLVRDDDYVDVTQYGLNLEYLTEVRGTKLIRLFHASTLTSARAASS